MTHAEIVLAALQRQGFGVYDGDPEYVIISRDARRQHHVPAATFTGNDEASLIALRIVVVGLEQIEGFRAPAEFWED